MDRDHQQWRDVIIEAVGSRRDRGPADWHLERAGLILNQATIDTYGGLLVDEIDHKTFTVVAIEMLAHEAAGPGAVIHYLMRDGDFQDAVRSVWSQLRREWRVGAFAEQGPLTIDVLVRNVEHHMHVRAQLFEE